MRQARNGHIHLKSKVEALLREANPDERAEEWALFPARGVVNPLLSFLFHTDEVLKGRAAAAVGIVVARMAGESLEFGRNIMRRLIWSLNDESGGIGWGSPMAMAEILARNECLACEYAPILVSYIVEDGNLLENGPLEREVLWGIGRLARVRPHLVECSAPHVLRYLQSKDPGQRGTALWTLGFFPAGVPSETVEPLLRDPSPVRIFSEGEVREEAVGDLALRLLKTLSETPAGSAFAPKNDREG